MSNFQILLLVFVGVGVVVVVGFLSLIHDCLVDIRTIMQRENDLEDFRERLADMNRKAKKSFFNS